MRYVRLIPPVLATGTLAWCVFAGWWIWTTPVRYVGLVSDPDDPNKTVQSEEFQRFADVSGLGATPLFIPVVLTGLAAVAAWRKRPLALLGLGLALFGYGFVTGFSIGSAYLPAGGVLTVAGLISLASDRRKQVDSTRTIAKVR